MNKLLKNVRYALIGLLLLTTINGQVCAAELISVVNRNEVGVNQTFRLQISYAEQVATEQLDLSELSADFEILSIRPQSSSSTQIVNGQRTQSVSTTWSLILAPKRTGFLTIPAFNIGNDQSRAIQIRVSENAQLGEVDQPLTAVVKANKGALYPGQQLLVEVELSAQSDVGNLNGPELVIADAEVVPLDQQSSQRIENGLARSIVTLKYAVFAKSTGELVIPRMTYTGNKGVQRSIFSSPGTQVLARTREHKVPVQAAPNKAGAAWLAAENVALTSSWSRDPSDLKVGEPITRTITVTAVAQRASAIPPLTGLAESGDYNVYTDQPQLDNQTSARGFTGTRIESQAIVATREGELQIPETRLAWFDTGAKRWKEAVLPAETLSVAAGSLAAPPASLSPVVARSDDALDGGATASNNQTIWQLASAVLALLVLVQSAVILKLRAKRNPHTASRAEKNRNASEQSAWKRLSAELRSNNSAKLRQAIVDWLNVAQPKHTSWTLQELRKGTQIEQLSEQIQRLEGALFDQSEQAFDSAELNSGLRTLRTQILKPSKSRGDKPALEALYKN